MLGHMLKAAGYEVIDASDGRQGVQRNREAPTDVIIADIIMPEQEELETITRHSLVHHEKWPRTHYACKVTPCSLLSHMI